MHEEKAVEPNKACALRKKEEYEVPREEMEPPLSRKTQFKIAEGEVGKGLSQATHHFQRFHCLPR